MNGNSSATEMNIVKYIMKNNNEIIIKKINQIVYNMTDICNNIIGEVHHGVVKRPNYGQIMNVTVKESSVPVMIVIK